MLTALFAGWHGGNLEVNLGQSTGQPRGLNSPEIGLSGDLMAAWTNFAKPGNPNGSGNSPWPQFTTSSQNFFSENIPASSTYPAAQYSADHKCDYWNPIRGY